MTFSSHNPLVTELELVNNYLVSVMELGQNTDTQSSDSTTPFKIIPSPAATA